MQFYLEIVSYLKRLQIGHAHSHYSLSIMMYYFGVGDLAWILCIITTTGNNEFFPQGLNRLELDMVHILFR